MLNKISYVMIISIANAIFSNMTSTIPQNFTSRELTISWSTIHSIQVVSSYTTSISWIRPWFSMLLVVFLKLLEQGNCTLCGFSEKRSHIRDHRHFWVDKNTKKRSLPTASKYIVHLGPLLYIPSKHILLDNLCIISNKEVLLSIVISTNMQL